MPARVLGLLLATGCVGTGQGLPNVLVDEALGPTTFPEIQEQIFDQRCAPQCHSGGAASKGLALEPGRSLQSLVDVPSVEVPGLMRVAPGDSANSYLMVKLQPFDGRRLGSRMPRTGPPYLSGPQLRALAQWIDAGASEEWEAGDEAIEDTDEPLDSEEPEDTDEPQDTGEG